MSDRQICTPRKAFTQPGSNDREHFYISTIDAAKIRRMEKWEADVTDLDTGAIYTLKGAPCTIPTCYCDAVVINKQDKPQ